SINEWRDNHYESHKSSPEDKFTHAKEVLKSYVSNIQELVSKGTISNDTAEAFVEMLAHKFFVPSFNEYYSRYRKNLDFYTQFNTPEGRQAFDKNKAQLSTLIEEKKAARGLQ